MAGGTPPSPIDADAIGALVDRFLAERQSREASITRHQAAPTPGNSGNSGNSGNPEAGKESPDGSPPPPAPPVSKPAPEPVPAAAPEAKSQPQPPSPGSNGHRPQAVDFVCEDDVRRALARGEKIYIHARTIITPSARDLGTAREVFARG
jgi:hypothetical protein